MTASASAWQPAISYSLTGALVLFVVASSTPLDSAVYQTLPADVCVVTWRYPARHANVECHLFKCGNMLSVFFFFFECLWLFPQIALTYHWVTKCLHRNGRGYKVKSNGSVGIYSAMQWHLSISLNLVLTVPARGCQNKMQIKQNHQYDTTK